MSWFTEVVVKYFWCCLGFDFMYKHKVIENIKLKYIQKIAFSKQLSDMCESVFTMYDPNGMFLQAVDFLNICSVGTCPDCISVINVSVYEGMILIEISCSDSAQLYTTILNFQLFYLHSI